MRWLKLIYSPVYSQHFGKWIQKNVHYVQIDNCLSRLSPALLSGLADGHAHEFLAGRCKTRLLILQRRATTRDVGLSSRGRVVMRGLQSGHASPPR